MDYNGRTITTVTYHYGDTIESIANPTRASDETYTYTFNGWDATVVACVGDATYMATYTATEIEDPNTPGINTEPTEPDIEENTPSDNDSNNKNEEISDGVVVSIVAGSAVVAGAGGFSLFWLAIKKRRFSDLLKIFKKK